MTPKPLDFSKVEALRKHMLLTVSDIAELFGVSRITYYGWVAGKPIRKSNEETVRKVLRKLLWVMTQHQWPPPEMVGATAKYRKQRLIELLNSAT